MNVEELCAREAIRDLISRYCTEADSGRLAQVIELFTVDGEIEFGGGTHTGPEGITGMFTASGAKVRESGIRGRVLHSVGTVTIDLESADTARAHTYFTVLSAVGADHWGRYRDELVRVDGAWRFRRRVISVDGFQKGGIGEVLA